MPFDPNWLVFREVKYSAVLGFNDKDYKGVIEALKDGKMKSEAMITARIALGDLVEHGYRLLSGQKENHVKVLIDMSVGA